MTEDKFLELVHKHKTQIYQHTLYLLKNREDAEDITQETFHQGMGTPGQIASEDCAFMDVKMCPKSLFQPAKATQISGAI